MLPALLKEVKPDFFDTGKTSKLLEDFGLNVKSQRTDGLGDTWWSWNVARASHLILWADDELTKVAQATNHRLEETELLLGLHLP